MTANPSEPHTAPRSPAALRLAHELVALRRVVRAQSAALAVVVVLEVVIAVMIRMR